MNFPQRRHPGEDPRDEAVALDRRCIATIRKNYEAQVKKGKLKQDKYGSASLLSTTLSHDDLKDADLVIEAVFEEMGVKQKVRDFDAVKKPGAILASNTSTLDSTRSLRSPGPGRRTWSVPHFFSPANVMKLLEVARHRQGCSPPSWPWARRSRRPALLASAVGFIGNRMIEQYGRQGGFLLDGCCTLRPGRPGDRVVWIRDGAVPHGATLRATTSLGHCKRRYVEEARHEDQHLRKAASAKRPALAGTTTCPRATPSLPSWSRT